MGNKTGISWTQATWNPVVGCSIHSPGCNNCYAMREANRFGSNPSIGGKYAGLTEVVKGKPVWNGVVRLWPKHLDQPIRWGRPRLIFVNSMSDLFHEDLPTSAIDQVFAVMAIAKHHTYQVLTKRSDRMRKYCNDLETPKRIAEAMREMVGAGDYKIEWPLPNVWLGVSTERQREADIRVVDLLRTLAAVRWVSAEPLIGRLSLRRIMRQSPESDWTYCDNALDGFVATKNGGAHAAKLDWVVIGGESCKPRLSARPMHRQWARDIRDECVAHGTPFFFKQWGEWAPAPEPTIAMMADDKMDGVVAFKPFGEEPIWMKALGKDAAGDLLDGERHHNWPAGFDGVAV